MTSNPDTAEAKIRNIVQMAVDYPKQFGVDEATQQLKALLVGAHERGFDHGYSAGTAKNNAVVTKNICPVCRQMEVDFPALQQTRQGES